MNSIRLRSQRGMVLFSALTILSVLLVLGIAIRVMLQNDYRVLANLRGGTETFYVSVAGIEWGKNEIAQSTTFPPAPADRTQSFAGGVFSVSFVSPAVVAPLSARILVRSVGTIRASSHTLQAQLMKSYDLADAALGLRGNASAVRFGDNPILISGADHDAATGGVLGRAPSRPALSTSDEAQRQLVLAAMGDPPRAGMLEGGTDASSLSASSYLSSSLITQMSNSLCSSASVVVTAIPEAGSLSVQDETWGNRDAPQVRCVQGLPSSGDSLTLSGTVSGAGILIVKDADLVLSGAFRWEGLIIVSGDQVGLKIIGSSGQEVLGALLVNEIGIRGSDSYIMDIQGSLRLLFSRQALARAAGLMPTAILNDILAGLPSVISQEYWRAVNL
jgi:hypothetical protein